MTTEETTITELELAEEVLADMVIPVDTSTDTKSVSLKQLRAWLGSSLPTGFIIASFGKMDDERFTLLDGKTLSKQGTYGAFCAKVEAQVQAGKWYACSEEEYNADLLASGQCSKFVIGVDYVRIPKLGNSLCSGVVDGKIPVVGNGQVVHLTDGANTSWLNAYNSGNSHLLTHSNLPNNPTLGTIANIGGTYVNGASGISQDATKSGIEGKINSIEVFYYMVVSTEGQTANVEIDINKVYEDLNLKANSNLSNVSADIDYVVESYNDGTNWYRVYKSGWIEQGGILRNRTEEVKTFNLLKPFANTNYTGNAGICTASAMGNTYTNVIYGICAFSAVSTTQSCVRTVSWSNSSWFACGQGA